MYVVCVKLPKDGTELDTFTVCTDKLRGGEVQAYKIKLVEIALHRSLPSPLHACSRIMWCELSVCNVP